MWISKRKLNVKIIEAKREIIDQLESEREEEYQWESIKRLEERVRDLEYRINGRPTGTGKFVETPF